MFLLIFTSEAIIKILGFGTRYFKDGWNIFDFLVLIVSAVGIFLTYFTSLEGASSTTIIRSLRIARMVKLFRK